MPCATGPESARAGAARARARSRDAPSRPGPRPLHTRGSAPRRGGRRRRARARVRARAHLELLRVIVGVHARDHLGQVLDARHGLSPAARERCVCVPSSTSRVRSTRASRRRRAARLAHGDAFFCAVGAERRSLLRSFGGSRSPRARDEVVAVHARREPRGSPGGRGAPPRAMKRTRPRGAEASKAAADPDLCAKGLASRPVAMTRESVSASR